MSYSNHSKTLTRALLSLKKSGAGLALCFGVLVMIFVLNYLVLAWTEPSSNPPAGNVPAPLNVGNTGQSKAGGLILNTGGAATGLVVDKGNVGIGITNPAFKLDVSGQIHATGDVCIDAGGGKCLSSAGGGSQWITSGNNIYYNSGNIGIGTANPSNKLEVSGKIYSDKDVCISSGACLSQLNDFLGARPLVNNRHTYKACTDAGGAVVDSDVSYPQCRFNAASCPGTWTQYKGFNAFDSPQTKSAWTNNYSWGNQQTCLGGKGCTVYFTFPPLPFGNNGLPCQTDECHCTGSGCFCYTSAATMCRDASTASQIGCY